MRFSIAFNWRESAAGNRLMLQPGDFGNRPRSGPGFIELVDHFLVQVTEYKAI